MPRNVSNICTQIFNNTEYYEVRHKRILRKKKYFIPKFAKIFFINNNVS